MNKQEVQDMLEQNGNALTLFHDDYKKSLVKNITQFTHLRSLSFIKCGLGNSDLPNLQALTNLEHLNLESNYLTDVPKRVMYLTNLKTLNLNFNPIKELRYNLNALTNLEKLDLCLHEQHTFMSQVHKISHLTQLKKLTMYKMQVQYTQLLKDLFPYTNIVLKTLLSS